MDTNRVAPNSTFYNNGVYYSMRPVWASHNARPSPPSGLTCFAWGLLCVDRPLHTAAGGLTYATRECTHREAPNSTYPHDNDLVRQLHLNNSNDYYDYSRDRFGRRLAHDLTLLLADLPRWDF